MAHDNLIECTRCGSNACYTKEINSEISISLCYGCGFQSNSIMTVGSDLYNEQIETLPELYKILMDEEENGKTWMPSFHNVKDKGMVFVNGDGRENWGWSAVKAIEIPEDEREKYKGETYRADMTTIKNFSERDFMDALSYAGLLPE